MCIFKLFIMVSTTFHTYDISLFRLCVSPEFRFLWDFCMLMPHISCGLQSAGRDWNLCFLQSASQSIATMSDRVRGPSQEELQTPEASYPRDTLMMLSKRPLYFFKVVWNFTKKKKIFTIKQY